MEFKTHTIDLWPRDCEHHVEGPRGYPRLEVIEPIKRTDAPRAAVVVLPGGGYGGLAPHEGMPFAELFARHGMVSAVCYYRVAPNRWPGPYTDAARAMRLMRWRAEQFHIDPQRVGLLGFSAGGHNAMSVAIRPEKHLDPQDELVSKYSARPDRLMLGYPVVSFMDHGHQGSCNNLLGPEATDEQRREFSGEFHVDANTPPTFLFHAVSDGAVPVANSIHFMHACIAHDVPVELHAYQTGRHGVGMAEDDPKLRSWSGLMIDWLGDWCG